MLDSFDFLRIPGFKVLHPEPESVELDGIVDVFDRSYKGEEEHQAFEFLGCLKFLVSEAFVTTKVEEKGEDMDDERIPHQEEGHGRPQAMATVVQVERGE